MANDDPIAKGFGFIDGVVSVFEGITKARVTFIYVETDNESHVCTFCHLPTRGILQCKASVVTSLALCPECLTGIKEAHQA